MNLSLWPWGLFGVPVLSALALDLGLFRSLRVVDVPNEVSLGIIAAALAPAVAASLKWPDAATT